MAKPEKEENFRELLERYLKELQYGTITLVIQDGKVVQVNKEEKIRLR